MKLYANSFDGGRYFEFEDFDEFEAGAAKTHHDEFDIGFSDGTDNESALFSAVEPTQANVEDFFTFVEEIADEDDLVAAALWLMNQQGDSFDEVRSEPADGLRDRIRYQTNVHWTEEKVLEEYAEQLAEDTGLSDSVPESLRNYIDYQAMGRDMMLNGEVRVFEHNGTAYVMDALQ